MRYFKGSKIEVLNYVLDPPSISWRPAEIISGNGRTYHVSYSPESDAITERVPRKVIRPCPPPVEGGRSWVSGDIVEVFEGNSWKPAQVTRVVGGGSDVFVRLVGFSQEFHASNIRVRQTWREDRWVVFGKEHYQEYPRSMTNKGLRLTSPLVETCGRTDRKIDSVEKEGRGAQLVARHPYHLLKKVDVVASPHLMFGEIYIHTSLGHKATTNSKLDMDRRKLNTRFKETDSTCSSVSSCSGNNTSYTTSPTRDSDSNEDEADSSYELGGQQCVPRLASPLPRLQSPHKEIHELELSAYRSTMFAFHASGPLTWEREALLTNLRLILHISNDEHLLELRSLVSADTYVRHSLEETIPVSL